jgi:hypothetical protein
MDDARTQKAQSPWHIRTKLLSRFHRYSNPAIVKKVLSTFMCKFHIGQFFEEWQVVMHFSYRV